MCFEMLLKSGTSKLVQLSLLDVVVWRYCTVLRQCLISVRHAMTCVVGACVKVVTSATVASATATYSR